MKGQKRCTRILDMAVVCAVVSMVCIGTASAGDAVATLTNSVDSIAPQDIQLIYDSVEASLIARLRAGEKLDKRERVRVIDVLGHIRSEKAVPYLLDCLEFTQKEVILPDGHQILIGASTHEGTYPVLSALRKIGSLSTDRIVELISQSSDGSKREQILVALGSACDRKAFRSGVRDQISKVGVKKQRWERILSLLQP